MNTDGKTMWDEIPKEIKERAHGIAMLSVRGESFGDIQTAIAGSIYAQGKSTRSATLAEERVKADTLATAMHKFLRAAEFVPPWKEAGARWGELTQELNATLTDYYENRPELRLQIVAANREIALAAERMERAATLAECHKIAEAKREEAAILSLSGLVSQSDCVAAASAAKEIRDSIQALENREVG